MRNALFTLAFLFAVTCRFGSAFVMPGDVVLGPDRGVIFNNAQCPMPNRVMATSPTPPQLIEQVVRTSETTRLRDESGHARLRAKVYTAGEIDGRWTEAIDGLHAVAAREHRQASRCPTAD